MSYWRLFCLSQVKPFTSRLAFILFLPMPFLAMPVASQDSAPLQAMVFFWAQDSELTGQGSVKPLGSGFIVDRSGIVMTARHVLERRVVGEDIVITISSKNTFPVPIDEGDIVCAAGNQDVCIVRIPTDAIPPTLQGFFEIECGVLDVGVRLRALGFAGGANRFAGVIQPGGEVVGAPMINRLVPTDIDLVPTMSGGPVLNEVGRVVGLVKGADSTSPNLTFITPMTSAAPTLLGFGIACDVLAPNDVVVVTPPSTSEKPVYFWDGLANILRGDDDSVIAVRPEASPVRRERNAKVRRDVFGTLSEVSDESEIVELVRAVLMKIWRDSSSVSDSGIAPPSVKEINLWAFVEPTGADIPVEDYLQSCSDSRELLAFMRTQLEATIAYKTIVTMLYGAEAEQLVAYWGRVPFPTASAVGDSPDNPLQNRSELALDALLSFGVFDEQYAAIIASLDEAEPEWQGRISNWAKMLLTYDQLLSDTHPERFWSEIPIEFDINASSSFGCERSAELRGWFEFDMETQEGTPTSVHVHHGADADGRDFHDSIFAFWARRDVAETSDELRIFLEALKRDYEGTHTGGYELIDLVRKKDVESNASCEGESAVNEFGIIRDECVEF
ncbi:serine protease [uncultured Tateyamaria sp.]|uniref:S1 family peptidase n=1 Tax=uncultured Tateyamaria sp. TaxID=455651 RepID=UPI00260403D7|nr:serine protease [uncultured Tateyamaria sp.]